MRWENTREHQAITFILFQWLFGKTGLSLGRKVLSALPPACTLGEVRKIGKLVQKGRATLPTFTDWTPELQQYPILNYRKKEEANQSYNIKK